MTKNNFKRRKRREVELVCHGCINLHRRVSKPKTFKGYLTDNGEIALTQIQRHFDDHKFCNDYYCQLEIPLSDSRVDLYPDLLEWRNSRSTGGSTPSFTSHQLGLTSMCSINDYTSRLDNQVMYHDVSVGQLSLSLVQSSLKRDFTEYQDDSGSCDSYDEDFPFENDDLSLDDNGSVDFFESVDIKLERDEPLEDTILDGPQSLPYLTISTPTPDHRFLSDRLKTEIQLLSILRHHKIALCVHKKIYDWAYEASLHSSLDFSNVCNPYRGREKVIKLMKDDLLPHLTNDHYEKKLLAWLPDLSPQEITLRSFENALRSLLSNKDLMHESNLSFPNADTPISCKRNPILTTDMPIEELHHGSWWIDTWNNDCDCSIDSIEILVPLIFYTDGITVDAHGKHTLTPLNFTLGILNTQARKRKDAFETIYFHPSKSSHISIDNVQNLHNGIELALKSLLDIWKENKTVIWDNLPWVGKSWKVSMKFAIAFIIGDTEMHDKLCGRF